MIVGDYMTETVLLASPTELAETAIENMRLGEVRHLPVVDEEGRVHGIVSIHDIGQLSWTKQTSGDGPLTVADVMTSFASTLRADDDLVLAAQLFVNRRHGAMPVVDHRGVLVGIISPTDVIRAFLELTKG